MYVCICNAVTDRQIEQAVYEGALTLEDLQRTLAVGSQCGQCKSCARDCLAALQQQNMAVSGVVPCFI
jgi:bacterioferritin-associated ferredoxin